MSCGDKGEYPAMHPSARGAALRLARLQLCEHGLDAERAYAGEPLSLDRSGDCSCRDCRGAVMLMNRLWENPDDLGGFDMVLRGL